MSSTGHQGCEKPLKAENPISQNPITGCCVNVPWATGSRILLWLSLSRALWARGHSNGTLCLFSVERLPSSSGFIYFFRFLNSYLVQIQKKKLYNTSTQAKCISIYILQQLVTVSYSFYFCFFFLFPCIYHTPGNLLHLSGSNNSPRHQNLIPNL